MRKRLLTDNNRPGGDKYPSATGFLRLASVLTLLFLGGFAARASGPVLTLSSSYTVNEDSFTDLSVGVTDSAVPIFTVATSATSSNTNLISNSSLIISGAGATRLLAIRPGLHKSGSATITVIASDSQPARTTNTFTLTVTPTNYPPVFLTSIGNVTRNQNAPATNFSFSISDVETAATALTVTATSTNTALVPDENLALSGTGSNRVLTVTQATNENGTTLIELVVTDGGGAKATNDFVLTVWAINQPPTFTMSTNRLSYVENFGAVTISNFITNVTSGPPDQAGETNYFVLHYTTNFFTQNPAVDTNGTLTFQVGTNFFGTNTITFALISSGSTTNGGKNSLTNTLTLDVPFVNQPPSFALSTNLLLAGEETLAVTNVGFLANLSVGPTNESSQTWTFTTSTVTTNTTNALFTVLPAIATNGTLTFHPAAHSFGTNTVTVVMTDSGGTNNGGINTYTNSFQIGVVQTNHVPVIVAATNFVVLENGTNLVGGTNGLSATVNVWDYDTLSSNLVLTATSLNTNLATVSVTGTNVAATTNAVFTITFAPLTNANGVATIQLIATEGSLSKTNTLTLSITPVNQPPSFTLSTNLLLVGEETLSVTDVGFLTNLSAGPTNESKQTWTFTTTTVTTNSTNALFTVLPAIATNGTLTFHPTAHSFGTNTVTVVMTDSGGTTNGGINAYTNSFQIGVVQTNHVPVIVAATIVTATNYVVLENGTNLVGGTNGLSASVNVWDYDTQSSNLVLTATSLSTNLANVSVTGTNVATATNTLFTITFAPVTNANGVATIQLVATEDGLSKTNTLTLSITPVNQPPSFTLSTNLFLVGEETLAVTNVGFLTNLSAGPTNESSQKWTFTTSTVTTNSTNALFTVLPAIATNGTLTFHPTAHSFGTNTVTVVMTDSGGTNNGGINAYTNSFQIGVVQTNHAPVIIAATNFVVLENGTNLVGGTNGLSATVNVWDYDTLSSNLVLTATSLSTNLTTISVTGTNVATTTNAVFTITFAPVTNANGVATIQLVATEGSLSKTNTLTLHITPVNQPPSFTLSTNLLLVGEETLTVTKVGFLTNLNAGPTNESTQTWTFATSTVTTNSTNALFTVLPIITPTGTLTFHPTAHSFGTNTVTVVMTDTGGTNNGGINAYTNSFQIGVVQTNHAPVIVAATSYAVLENGTNLVNGTNGLSATVNVWDYDTLSSNLVLTATSLSTNLATVSVTGTNVATTTNAVFTITLAPLTNANGVATIQLIATEGSLSKTNTLILTIIPVNQPPHFTLSTNLLLVGEETLAVTNVGFLTNLSAGPTNESSQKWTFTTSTVTTNSTNALFTVLPAIATNGTLTFHPTVHSFGTNTVTVVMTDTGGTNNGGINAYTNSFQIGVVQTNHAPVIVAATNFVVLENGTNLVGGTNGLSATVNVWDYDTLSSNLVLTATSLSTNLATVSVTGTNVATTTNAVFTITFAPLTNANGVATIQLIATEGSLSKTNTLTLSITPVNQPPSFTLSTNLLLVGEETLAVTNVGFLTNLSAGPTNESSQKWTFTTSTVTTNSTNALFTVLPAIATNGTLTFHPAAHSFGTNTVTVVMTDNGGTNNGGINAYTNSFQIGVVQTNHAPVIVAATNFVVLENGTNLVGGTNGLSASVNVWDYDTLSSNLVLTATSLSTNLATVSVTGTNVATTTNAVFTITLAPLTNANGVATIQLIATEGSLSKTNTLTLSITPVNQPPNFTLSTNLLLVGEETLAVTNVGFLTNLSAGPTNESKQTWAFTVTTVTTNSTNALFTVLPAIATNGTLTFHPAAHSFGTNTVKVIMTDNGGTNNGGINAYTNSFQIGVVQTNHAPVIVAATNFVVLENGTNLVGGTNGLSASVNVWDYDAQSSNLVLTATSLSTNLTTVSVTGTNVATTTNAVFTVTFAPLTNANGVATIQLVATEGSLSKTNTLTLSITPVNQPPSFTLSTNLLLVGEETLAFTNVGFLTNLSAGPTNESKQTWTFTVTTVMTNSTNAIFTVLPAIATNGTLTFHPAAHSFGTNTVKVIMTDSGGTNNGGINTYSNSFLIGVVRTNHIPVIVAATNYVVLENGTNLVGGTNGLSASVNVWDYDMQATNLILTASSLSTNLANVSVTGTNVATATNAIFTITFAPLTNANGVATIQLVATEDGLSKTNTLTLSITPVNQPPSFTLSTNLFLVGEETLAVTNVGFLTNLNAGPTNENKQTWTFTTSTVTTNSTNALFTVLPAIATNGTLTFHPTAHSFGTNTVTVVMTDNGGTNNGGINAYTNSFQIGVVQTNHAPVIVVATNFVVLENGTNLVGGTNGLSASVNVWDYDTLSSNLVLTATSLSTNLATVSVTGTNVATTTNAVFTVTFAPLTNANGVATIQLIATEGSLSKTNTLTLTITPVNQPPSFTLSTNLLLVGEETLAVTNVGFLTNLSAGPTNESSQTWTFTVTTVTTNATNALFTVLPAIATNGTLTFHPTAHSFGTNTVTVVMTDSGGTNNGGINAYTNSFQIGVVQTNHAPVIVAATNYTVLENGTNLVSGTNGLSASVNVWDYDTLSSNLVLTATSLSTNLTTVSVTGTNVATTTNALFTVTFAPLTNANGVATIQLIATEGSLSKTNTLTLTITPVNQPPSFTLSTNVLVVAENAGVTTNTNFVTSISVGPTNESSQTWTFTVFSPTNNATNATFAQFPTVTTNGTLSFKTATNSFGTNTVTVVMTDSGGTNNGGVNTYSNTFQLQVTQVQYPPAFTGITNKTILENATTNLSLAFTLYDPLTTNFTVTCVSSNTNLVTVSVGGTGTARTLVFAPVTNANGSTTVSVTADDGSLTNSTNLTVTIIAVNQAPSFDLALTNFTVDKYDVAVSIPNALTNILAGPTNESSQTVSFTVTNSDSALFLVPPSVNAAGTLAFTPGATGGTITVGIKAVDNGGTANGGVNTSAVQTVTITIPANPFPYLTGTFAGLFFDTNGPAIASSGYFDLLLATNGTFNGYVLCAGDSNTFSGQFSISNSYASVTNGNYVLSLTVDTSANWTETISGSVSNTVGNWNVTLQSYLAGYSAAFPTPLAGDYLMGMAGSSDPTVGPSGYSVLGLIISNNGVASLTGDTSDNTFFQQVSQISLNGNYPLYAPLYGNASEGALIGWLNFTGDLDNSVDTNSTIVWFNEAGATTLYPGGFTNQAVPVAALYDSTLSDLLSFSSGTVILSGGSLGTPITNAVTISANVITVDPSATNGLTLTINRSSGEVLGSFVDPSNHTNLIDSVIIQNSTNAVNGYFDGPSQVGSFILFGN